jgi:hypothetical protein
MLAMGHETHGHDSCGFLRVLEVIMLNQENKDPNTQNQQGAPQQTTNMPSTGNSPTNTGATGGTDEGTRGRTSDVEGKGGTAGTAAGRAYDQGETESTGDPGRTPGKAEGVDQPDKTGNE